MSREDDRPSAPEDFGPARKLITLPVPGPKGPLRIEIEAASLEELVPLIQGLPGSGRDVRQDEGQDPLSLTLSFLTQYEERAEAIVARWATAPPISFDGPKPGHIEWRGLHLQNRLAIINGITLFSQTGSVGEAERFATFPAQQLEGSGNGRRARGAVADGNAPASAVAKAAASRTG